MMYAELTGKTNRKSRRIKSRRGNRLGKERMINLLDSRIGNAERTMTNNISNDCYSTGTADGGKQIGGLQLLVADIADSGTVGGIDPATWAFWRNNVKSFATEALNASALCD